MLRRQGIGFEKSKCTTSLQAHTQQHGRGVAGSGEDEHVMKRSAAGKSELKLLRAFKRTEEM